MDSRPPIIDLHAELAKLTMFRGRTGRGGAFNVLRLRQFRQELVGYLLLSGSAYSAALLGLSSQVDPEILSNVRARRP